MEPHEHGPENLCDFLCHTKDEEQTVVALSNTSANPDTVMVHDVHAHVAHSAMLCPEPPPDEACCTDAGDVYLLHAGGPMGTHQDLLDVFKRGGPARSGRNDSGITSEQGCVQAEGREVHEREDSSDGRDEGTV
mmetsp:Transcript_12061/g.23268  ORF Transcript_12061/g.23268 Transcript_12061/m.23268 type:complete len:134 (+) Transcript_12061:862-1263(+)